MKNNIRNGRRTPTGEAEIDLTPLIDVLFIMIIFFVLSASFIQGEISLNLPTGTGAPPTQTNTIISMKTDGALTLNGRPTNLPTLLQELTQQKTTNPSTKILLAAEDTIPYGQVATMLDRIRNTGITDIGLALNGHSPQEP